MNKIEKPAWLLFAEECREKQFKDRRPSKDSRRLEDSMRRDWLEAREKYSYEGSEHDWQYLMGWRGRR